MRLVSAATPTRTLEGETDDQDGDDKGSDEVPRGDPFAAELPVPVVPVARPVRLAGLHRDGAGATADRLALPALPRTRLLPGGVHQPRPPPAPRRPLRPLPGHLDRDRLRRDAGGGESGAGVLSGA